MYVICIVVSTIYSSAQVQSVAASRSFGHYLSTGHTGNLRLSGRVRSIVPELHFVYAYIVRSHTCAIVAKASVTYNGQVKVTPKLSLGKKRERERDRGINKTTDKQRV